MFQQQERMIAACFVGTLLALPAPAAQAQAPTGGPLTGGYGTNPLSAAMPVAIQNQKMLIGLFGLAVNAEFTYPKYFSMIPLGPTPKVAQTKGFFDTAIAQNPKPQTVAIVAADAEFSIKGSEGAHENAKAVGLKIVYDKRYPPA